MPWTAEQKKADRERKKKIEEERQAILGTLDKYKALDETKEYASGEQSTWSDLYKIFLGIDPNADPDALPKKNPKKFINPSIHEFVDRGLLTLEQWLEGRREFRSKKWDLANLLYGHKGKYHEKAHGLLFEAFPKMDNTTLPFGYNQDQLNKWLLKQNERHDYLIEFPRGFRKSTGCIIDIVQWILNAADVNILICTSTKKLAKLRVEEVRSHFEVADYNKATEFQFWFPEFCMPKDEGSSENYQCPMARLRSPYATVGYTSVESSKAGFRATHLYFDDAQDDKNYKEPDQRTSVIETFDLACELLIRPYGYCIVVGTRYTDGRQDDNPEGRPYDKTDTKIPDLYGEITHRIKRFDTGSWNVLIEPAWRLKPGIVDMPFIQYEAEHVDLLMDEGGGTFKVLKEKAVTNETLFRCNQLNEPAAHLGDSTVYVNHYTDGLLDACETHILLCPPIGRDFIFIDYANSVREQSDFSVMVSYRIVEFEDKDPIAYLRSVRFGHWTNSQLAQQIVSFYKKWGGKVLIEELVTTSSFFKEGIQTEKLKQGTEDFDVHWFKTDNQSHAKELRIKALEVLAVSGRWKICTGEGTESSIWREEFRKQFTQYTGHKTRKNHVSGRHDDIPDACAMLHRAMRMGNSTPADLDFQKKLDEAIARRRQYARIYGEGSGSYNPSGNSMEDLPRNPIADALEPLKATARESQISFDLVRKRWNNS